ncbi:phage tail protein [Achromobacter sp. RTa]|uniref:TipJ family phage tail tip protein n=1 Tax=Achromobacter sp. RTa TaxID=1532557 RepID=UPI00068C8660|nr:phage tail protein [Achromobacter sp. RTa]
MDSTVRDLIGYGGGKGGGGGRVAKEAPDSLHNTQYARILDLITVGPSGGPYTGDILRDTFLNGTPIRNEDGSENFPGVEVHFTLGTQNQDPIPGFPGAENTVPVGVRVKQAQAWTQQITNRDLDAVRVTLMTDRLMSQNTKNGDLGGARVDYAIDLAVDGGAFQEVLREAMDGKTTQRYARPRRIDLPPRATQWSIRVRRLTADSNSQALSNDLYIESYTEVVDQKLRYPMIAMVGYKIPATLFTQVPNRAVRWRGREIRVPSNYDALTRTYVGQWDGSWKLSVCANPAWVLLDLITNDIFGLGSRVNIGMVDPWGLYRIAQYCDEMVPDGQGGMEPRFRVVGQIAKRQDAYRVLQDVAAAFHGMSYVYAGTISTIADMPGTPVHTYTQANVTKEGFVYNGTRRRTRYTAARVSYSNMDDFGRAKVEPVDDLEGIARYGVRAVDVSAFMCPSRGQAQRMGRWMLMTSRAQTRGVRFSTGMEYATVRPGSIIAIADNVLAGANIGGRVREVVSTTTLMLDRLARVKTGDFITVNLPSGLCEERRVSGVEALTDVTKITVASAFSEAPQVDAGWSVSADDLKPQLFKVTNTVTKDRITAEITAVEDNPGKHSFIDSKTKLDPLPITVIPSRVMKPPRNVRISSFTLVDQNLAIHALRAEWEGAPDAKGYNVQWRREGGNWIALPGTTLTSVDVEGIRAGRYQARVQAESATGVVSEWAVSEFEDLEGSLEPPPTVAFLTASDNELYGITARWGYRDSISPVRRAELWFSPNQGFQDAALLSEIAYPGDTFKLPGLPAGTEYWFWIRLVDSLGEKGPFYPAENVTGVHGITNTNAGDYLEAIKNEVMAHEAGQQLISEMEGLDERLGNLGQVVDDQGTTLTQHTQELIAQGEDLRSEAQARIAGDQAQAAALAQQAGDLSEAIGQVSQDLQTEIQNRVQAVDTTNQSLQAQIDVLQSQVADIEGIQPWDAEKAYVKDDIVSWNGGLYRAKGPSTDVPPSSAASWEKIGDYSSLAEAVGQNTSEISGMKIVQAGQATRLDTLETSDGQQGSKIQTLEQTTATQAQRLDTLETTQGEHGSKIQTLETTTTEVAARTSTLETTTAETASKVTTLEQTTDGLAQRTSTLETVQGQQATKITNLEETTTDYALRISELRATATDQDASISSMEKVTASNVQSIRRVQVRQDGMASSIEQIETVSAGMAQQLTTLETTQGEQASKITGVEQTQADQAQRLTTLETSDDEQGGKIQVLETTTADLAQRTSTLETTTVDNSNRVASLETATTDMALRMAEVRAMTADTDASVYEAMQATKNNAQMSIRLSARADQNAADIVVERETRLTEKAATATALQNLDTKFEQNEAAIRDEALTRTTADSALASRIDVMEAKTADGFDSERSWSFDSGLDGWTAFNPANAAISWLDQSPYFIRATKLTDAIGRVDRIMAVAERYDPRQFPIVRVRVRFPSTYAANLFTLYVGMDSTGTGTNVIQRPVDGSSTAWQVVDFDLSSLAGFATTATVQRLILGDTRSGAYEIDYVAVGRYGVPISRGVYSQDINVLSTATQANTQAVQRLDAEMGDVTASVQTTNEAVAQLDGRVAANWGVKTQVVDGERVVTGAVSLGADGESSVFAVAVDKFVVFNSTGTTPAAKRVLPFAIVGNQVFMQSALIQDGTITSAKIGDAQITGAKIADATIDGAKIAYASIHAAHIIDAQINTAKIGIAQIDTLRIAAGAVVAGTASSWLMQIGASSGSGLSEFSHWSPSGVGGAVIFFCTVNCTESGVNTGNKRVQITTSTDGLIYDKVMLGNADTQAQMKDFYSPNLSWIGGWVGSAGASITLSMPRPSSGYIYGIVRLAAFTFQR